MKALEADAAKCKKNTFLFRSIDTVSACTIKDNNSNNNIVTVNTTNNITPSAEIIESDEEQDRTKESQSNTTALPFDYFLRPKPDDLNLFFNHHPQQLEKHAGGPKIPH